MAEAAKNIEPETPKAHKKNEPEGVKTRKVIFHNLQDKDAKGNALPIEFTYQGKKYDLYSGREYELPEDVIQHLKSRHYPIYEERPDPNNPDNTVCYKVGEEPRFALYPVA